MQILGILNTEANIPVSYTHLRAHECYTGYLYDEQLLNDSRARCEYTDEMLSMLDVLVDGEFVEALKDIRLVFRGSSNQRVIDVKKSLGQNEIVMWQPKVERGV